MLRKMGVGLVVGTDYIVVYRPFVLVLHLHQCKSSDNLHLQY
jgi:hypothetical protein